MVVTMTDKIEGTVEAWESGQLGQDEQFVQKADINVNEVDDALELQPISIRLPKALINDLKIFAELEGLGYQPLMRRILMRWVEGEKRTIANRYMVDMLKAKAAADQSDDDGDDDNGHKIAM